MWRKLSPPRAEAATPSAEALATKHNFDKAQRDIDQTISVLQARTEMLMQETRRDDR